MNIFYCELCRKRAMRLGENAFFWLKQILLRFTHFLYIVPIAFTLYIFVFEDYGKTKFISLLYCSLIALTSWLLHFWIKKTEYMGVLVVLIGFGLLWIFTPFMELLLTAVKKWMLTLFKFYI
jgi:hypothetical protein